VAAAQALTRKLKKLANLHILDAQEVQTNSLNSFPNGAAGLVLICEMRTRNLQLLLPDCSTELRDQTSAARRSLLLIQARDVCA
jgi:hypothetical protein